MISATTPDSPVPPMKAPKKRDRAETFGAIVVFTPLIVTAVSFIILAVPVYGIIGFVLFGYLAMAWWVFGVASLLVLFFALWGNRRAALYGALGMLESISTAVVLFMEWDSGAWYTVQGMKEPVLGADREAALVAGMRFVNPDAWQEGWAHSLGTTMVTTNQIHNPGVFDHLTLFGSAGITESAAKALAAQIADETVSVSAASSGLDPIAWMGRTDLSTHPVDPKTVEGVTEIGSHGGAVENYLNADGREVTGAATQGHNAGSSTEIIYRIHRAPYWHLGFIPEESVGYLDPRSEAMMQAVADFAERVEARQ